MIFFQELHVNAKHKKVFKMVVELYTYYPLVTQHIENNNILKIFEENILFKILIFLKNFDSNILFIFLNI